LVLLLALPLLLGLPELAMLLGLAAASSPARASPL
jgi:hypothetical protein